MLYSSHGELPNSPREVVDDCVHHLSSLKRETSFARMIDLLRPHDDDLGTFDPLRELRRRETQKLIKRYIGQLRDPRRCKLLPGREVWKESIFDPSAQLPALLYDGEARGCPGLERRHADRSDTRQHADRMANADFGGFWQPLGQ